MCSTRPGNITRNQRGQMAIFVALIFQVLFVLFAMAINVGLLVHDKINLQNSVDLAAYYMAQRQAEVLNAMAHVNYQIRQSWKLLTFRYRVIGAMGLANHPNSLLNPNPELSDTLYTLSGYDEPVSEPAICIDYNPTWAEAPAPRRGHSGSGQTTCQKRSAKIPNLPQGQAPVILNDGWNAFINIFYEHQRKALARGCEGSAAFNYAFAAYIHMAFRRDQGNRKQVLLKLAELLSNSVKGDFLELSGRPVRQGTEKTLRNNLTFGNDDGQSSFLGMELYNSLEGIPVDKWLPQVQVMPTLLYTDVRGDPNNCTIEPRPLSQKPSSSTTSEQALNALGVKQILGFVSGGEPPAYDPLRMSLGVEKNPWFAAYVGVKAKSQPRQIFFPLGEPVTLEARAYAKPFGGRIGPWYGALWPRTSDRSTGDKIDPLVPPRVSPIGDQLTSGNEDENSRLPNYSRYPGDVLGLKSRLALGSLQDTPTGKQLTVQTGMDLNIEYFTHIVQPMESGGGGQATGDILAWDTRYDKAPAARYYELAAIVPDIFDITYYSIDPNFWGNYGQKIQANRSALGMPGNILIRGDLGSRPDAQISIEDQYKQIASNLKGREPWRPEAYYYVLGAPRGDGGRDTGLFLTSWAPTSGAFRYDNPDKTQWFAQCQKPDYEYDVRVPGGCVAGGGRTGYSVKLVSRDALVNGEAAFGGPGNAGTILNPPPKDW